jgi:hypothetical protein
VFATGPPAVKNGSQVVVNQIPRRRVHWRTVAAQGYCAVQQGNVLAITDQPLTLDRRLEGTPPLGKELPMELTATVTAIMAIMSFGFLAAVILGMI